MLGYMNYCEHPDSTNSVLVMQKSSLARGYLCCLRNSKEAIDLDEWKFSKDLISDPDWDVAS